MNYALEAKKLVATIVLAVVANLGLIAFSRRTAEISTQFDPLTYSAVGFVTAASAVGAYATLYALKTYTERPLEYFFYISGIVLVASFGPIGHVALDMPEAGAAEINILGLTHVIAAIMIVGVLSKFELIELQDSST